MTTPSANHVSADNAEDIIRLAGSGSIPAVGLGTWKIPNTQASEVVWEAMRVGYRHLDCACDYGNEPEVGAGLSRAFADGLCRREQAWITSKLWNTYHDPRHVRLACERSLRDLLAYARMRPSVLQVELHPFLTQEKLLRYCRREGIAVTAFSPLGALSYFSLGGAARHGRHSQNLYRETTEGEPGAIRLPVERGRDESHLRSESQPPV